MEKGSGASSGFLGGWAASSIRWLYSASVSVTFPGSGSGSAGCLVQRRKAMPHEQQANGNTGFLHLIARLPFCRAGKLNSAAGNWFSLVSSETRNMEGPNAGKATLTGRMPVTFPPVDFAL